MLKSNQNSVDLICLSDAKHEIERNIQKMLLYIVQLHDFTTYECMKKPLLGRKIKIVFYLLLLLFSNL